MYRTIIADDEALFREWLASLLNSRKNFKVIGQASTGLETIHLVRVLKPDLVIADIYMPESDGIEVARHLRKHYPGVKVILVSAQEERAYGEMARDEGALTFIPKALFSLDDLDNLLQEVE